jgi:hypothetical protein
MEYELGKKLRLLRDGLTVKKGAIGKIVKISPVDDLHPIAARFQTDRWHTPMHETYWLEAGAFELIKNEDEAPVDLTKITTPFGLLDEDTQQRLQSWPHGWEAFKSDGWVTTQPKWAPSVTYRAKPAPERKCVWINVYEGNAARSAVTRPSRGSADYAAAADRTAVWRIEYNEDGSDPEIFVEDS